MTTDVVRRAVQNIRQANVDARRFVPCINNDLSPGAPAGIRSIEAQAQISEVAGALHKG